MNEAVLQAVEEHALTPEAIEQVIHLSERDDVTELQDKLEREQKDIEKRIARLVAAIETGGDAASLVAKLRELEARRRPSTRGRATCGRCPGSPPAVIENRLAEWRRLLRAVDDAGAHRAAAHPARTADVHAALNPISDEPDGYDFAGPTRFDKLFTGIAVETPQWVKDYTGKTGTEDIGPEDTFDGDYGRLLDRAYEKSVKVLASPSRRAPFREFALRVGIDFSGALRVA